MPNAETSRFVVQIFVTFASLLGVYIVFRLNSVGTTISDVWNLLDRSLALRGKSISHLAPREKIKNLFHWMKDPNDPLRNFIKEIDVIMQDLFNQMRVRRDIVRAFRFVIGFCGVMAIIFLCGAWPGKFSIMLGFLIFGLCIPLGFIIWAMTGITDSKYWNGVKEEWASIKAEVAKNV